MWTKDVMSCYSSRCSNTFLASVVKISQKCTKPEEVLEAIKRTMKQNIRWFTPDMLLTCYKTSVIRRKVATNSVENRCKDICINLPPRRRNTLVNKVKKWKLSDAKKCLQR